MVKRIAICTLIVLMFISLAGCSNRKPLESFVNIDRAMDIIEELTLPKYEGRLTGTPGNTLAEDYVADYFREIELVCHEEIADYRQSYEQKVILTEATPELFLSHPSGDEVKRFQYLSDFRIITLWPGLRIEGTVHGAIAVVKDVLDLESGHDYRDHILLIEQSVLNDGHPDGPYEVLDKILKSELKVKGILFNLDIRENDTFAVRPNIFSVVTSRGQEGFNNENGPFVGYCTQNMFAELEQGAHDNLELTISAHYTYKDATVANVIGFIPGTDEKMKDDVIIIGAHLDHVGENKDGTYQPGALDNASGIAAMMEIARALKDAGISPKKTIAFIAFNGEEMGLFGSTHYVRNPLFPQLKTNLINLDMVGSKKALPLTISSDMEQLKNEFYMFAIEQGIDCQTDIGLASDQIPFTLRNIQGITLIHNDQTHVHTPKDTLANVDKDRLDEVIRLVIGFIEETAY